MDDLRLGIQDNREFPVASRVEFTSKHMPPPLSVVIATTQAWPEIRGCLDSLYAQASEMGAEIIVADGNGRGLPDTESRYPQVRWLKALGATVFQLRALGMAAAKGDIVAVTEDHCRVTPGWCRQILRAHHEWPAAAVIGGAVENGATEHLGDWANFFIANGAFLLPIPTGEREDVTGQANISYKRGFLGSCLIHYHDGRCTAGFHRPRVSRRTWLFQLAKGLALPVRVLIDSLRLTLRIALRKPRHRSHALASAPLIAVLLCFHAAGEFVGYLTGPGSSPSQLR